MPTKTATKNTRWLLMEQRIEFMEKTVEGRLTRVEDSVKSLKDNEIAHLGVDIANLRSEMQVFVTDLRKRIEDIQAVIYKAVGAVGAIILVANILLRIWK